MISFIEFKSGRKELIDMSYCNPLSPFDIVARTKYGWYRRYHDGDAVRFSEISFESSPCIDNPTWGETDNVRDIVIGADYFEYPFDIRVNGVNIFGIVYLPNDDARLSSIVKIAMDAVGGSGTELVSWNVEL